MSWLAALIAWLRRTIARRPVPVARNVDGGVEHPSRDEALLGAARARFPDAPSHWLEVVVQQAPQLVRESVSAASTDSRGLPGVGRQSRMARFFRAVPQCEPVGKCPDLTLQSDCGSHSSRPPASSVFRPAWATSRPRCVAMPRFALVAKRPGPACPEVSQTPRPSAFRIIPTAGMVPAPVPALSRETASSDCAALAPTPVLRQATRAFETVGAPAAPSDPWPSLPILESSSSEPRPDDTERLRRLAYDQEMT